jgi:hypothetical protein
MYDPMRVRMCVRACDGSVRVRVRWWLSVLNVCLRATIRIRCR